MRSNCNLWAWDQFRAGKTEVIVLRLTKYSRISTLAGSAWWRWSLRQIGVLIGYPAWLLVQAAALLMYGKWWHVTTGTHEFLPIYPKYTHWIPPIIFEGEVCELEKPCEER